MITQLTDFFFFELLAFQWYFPESHGRWGCESSKGETREILPSGKTSFFRHIQCDSALEIKCKKKKKSGSSVTIKHGQWKRCRVNTKYVIIHFVKYFLLFLTE